MITPAGKDLRKYVRRYPVRKDWSKRRRKTKSMGSKGNPTAADRPTTRQPRCTPKTPRTDHTVNSSMLTMSR
jgi:hypothetical protein